MKTSITLEAENRLEEILERMKKKLNLGYELKVKWLPNGNSRLSGEVKGNTIFIYDLDFDVAVETLKHEFIDYTISQVIEPYKEVTNKLIALINENAYRKKEKLVEALSQLISKD